MSIRSIHDHAALSAGVGVDHCVLNAMSCLHRGYLLRRPQFHGNDVGQFCFGKRIHKCECYAAFAPRLRRIRKRSPHMLHRHRIRRKGSRKSGNLDNFFWGSLHGSPPRIRLAAQVFERRICVCHWMTDTQIRRHREKCDSSRPLGKSLQPPISAPVAPTSQPSSPEFSEKQAESVKFADSAGRYEEARDFVSGVPRNECLGKGFPCHCIG